MGHGESERCRRDRDRVDLLVEQNARSEVPLVFGDVGGLPMHEADGNRAPVASDRVLIRDTKRIKTKSVIWTAFGMVTG